MQTRHLIIGCLLIPGCGAVPKGPAAKLPETEAAVRYTPYVPPPIERASPPAFAAVPAGAPSDAVPAVGPFGAADPAARPPVKSVLPPGPMPQDAVVQPDLVYSIDVFELLFPVGTVSRNDELWKRIDETSVDVATYDVLYKNGIRVGVAPMADLKGLQDLMGERKSKQYVLSGAAGRQVEIEMAKGVEQQALLYFDLHNDLIGRRYDKSDNLLIMSFESTPRKPGWVRLAMLPTIRSTQKKLIYALLPGRPDKDFSYLVDETPINMNLRVDMPVSRFLVIAPSPEGTWPSSLGKAFLSKDAPSEKLERVIVVVPHAFKVEEK